MRSGKEEFFAAAKSPRGALGLYVTLRSPEALEATVGLWDWVLLDTQHSRISLFDCYDLIRVCEFAGVAPFIRTPSDSVACITRAIDAGACGVIVPDCRSAEQAKSIALNCLGPLKGERSLGASREFARWGRFPQARRSDPIVFVQIEHEQGIHEAADISQVPGIDGIMEGMDDLLSRQGIDPASEEATGLVLSTLSTLAAHASHAGILTACFCDDSDAFVRKREMGAQALLVAEDWKLLRDGGLAIAREASSK